MHRRDYEAIARVLNAAWVDDVDNVVDRIIADMGDMLAKDNPAFDRARFEAACRHIEDGPDAEPQYVVKSTDHLKGEFALNIVGPDGEQIPWTVFNPVTNEVRNAPEDEDEGKPHPEMDGQAGFHSFVNDEGEEYGSFEVFYLKPDLQHWVEEEEEGWHWWACFPGCIPDGTPMGPFATSLEAYCDALNA